MVKDFYHIWTSSGYSPVTCCYLGCAVGVDQEFVAGIGGRDARVSYGHVLNTAGEEQLVQRVEMVVVVRRVPL
jgi:hypothetical protein